MAPPIHLTHPPTHQAPTTMPLTIDLLPDGHFEVLTPAGTHLRVPCSEAGLSILSHMLLAQKRALLQSRLTEPPPTGDLARTGLAVGHPPSPTQHEIDHLLTHSQSPSDRCPFCIAGGPPKPAPRPQIIPKKSRRISPRELTLEELDLP